MIDFVFRYIDESKRVVVAASKAALRTLGHLGGSVRKDASGSIKSEGEQGSVLVGREPRKYTKKGKIREKWLKWNARKHVASKPGTPPLTHTRRLPRSIRYAVDAEDLDVLVGPTNSEMGQGGVPHELGGEFKGGDYPERSFMGPAMERQLPRFASDLAGSIGE